MSVPPSPAPLPAISPLPPEATPAPAPVARGSLVTPARRSVVELLHTADVLRRRFLLALAPYRVSLPQYNVLRILRGAAGTPLASTVIADRLIEQTAAVASLLDRMETLGWIGRDRGAPFGLLAYRLASAGEAVLAQVDPVLDAECEAVMAPLGDGEREALATVLRTLRDA